MQSVFSSSIGTQAWPLKSGIRRQWRDQRVEGQHELVDAPVERVGIEVSARRDVIPKSCLTHSRLGRRSRFWIQALVVPCASSAAVQERRMG